MSPQKQRIGADAVCSLLWHSLVALFLAYLLSEETGAPPPFPSEVRRNGKSACAHETLSLLLSLSDSRSGN